MAVQIPEVQRQGPIAPEGQTPLEMKVVDGSRQFAEKTNALVSAGDKIQSSYDTALHQGAEVTALNVGNQLDAFKRGKLAEAKKWEGDPTEKFAQIDKEVESFKGELLSKYKDAPDVTQKLVNTKLSEVDARTNVEKLTQLGIQHEAYKQKVVDATTDNNKQALMGMAQVYNPSDVHSKELFGAALDKVHEAILFQGETHGLAEKNPDGTYKSISPILVDQMRKAESDGLRRVIQMFNETGQVQKSKALLDDYRTRLTPKDLDIVLRGQKDAGLDVEALKFLPHVANLPIAQARAAAAKQFPDDVLQQERVIQKLETYKAQNERDNKYNETTAFKQGLKVVSKLMEDPTNAPVNKADLWSNPLMKNVKENMGLQNAETLEKLYFKPKVSDPHAYANLMDMKVNGDLAKISNFEDLQQHFGDLSEKDQVFFKKAWDKARDPTQGQSISQFKFLHEQLRNQLVSAGTITPNQFGKFSVSDQIKLNEYDRKMSDGLDGNIIGKSAKDMGDFVAKVVSGEVIQKATTPRAPDKFNSSATKEPKKVVSEGEAAVGLQSLSAQDLGKLKLQWSKENNGKQFGPSNKISELLEIYNQNNKAK